MSLSLDKAHFEVEITILLVALACLFLGMNLRFRASALCLSTSTLSDDKSIGVASVSFGMSVSDVSSSVKGKPTGPSVLIVR